ncbi:MAG: hypothetical protein EOO07_11745 [Chitinophagaceae bacterium]|nr:MAG: hypothetical protein EOO07_11745 [Chitinophagaceae bacterium]
MLNSIQLKTVEVFMLVQSSYSVALTQQVASPAKEQRQNVAKTQKNVADIVTISDFGKFMSANVESENSHENSRILDRARSDEKLANELLDAFTNGLDHPTLDISHYDPTTGMGAVYASTGLPVTTESEALFNNQATKLKAEKNALIQSEREKGTPTPEVLEKIFDLVDQQSKDYKAKIIWNRISS